MKRWPWVTAGFAALLAAMIAFASAAVSTAQTARPTITGNPVVGETLVSSDAGDTGVYKWQRCDPTVATCEDSDPNDPNWSHIDGANAQSYTIQPADLGFFIRVLAKGTSLGEQFASSPPVGPVTAAGGPPPQGGLTSIHGVQVLGETTSGNVKYKLPGQTGFQVLTTLTELPVGTVLDTRGVGNVVRLTAATGQFGNTTEDQSIEFFLGLFKITQPPGADAAANAKLLPKLSCGKGGNGKGAQASSAGPRAFAAARRKKLWGRGRGRYSTSGRGGTGSVVGTTFFHKESCNRASWGVTNGIGITVDVRGKKKDVELGPGEKFSIDL